MPIDNTNMVNAREKVGEMHGYLVHEKHPPRRTLQ
jgi:hypothetical protein